MKKIKFVTKTLAALMIVTAVSATDADAQIGKNLLNKAKQAGKEILQGNDSQQSSQQSSNQQQSQQPAQQQQTAPQQTNNQTAQPSQQTSKPAAKQNTPAEKPKEYTKADYTAEAQQLVGKVDSTSKLYDIIRVYMYLYNRTEKALDDKDYDFLVDSFTYYSDVWRIVDNIGITDVGFSEFDNRYYAEEKPKDIQRFITSDFYMVKSKHKDDAHVSKLQDRITNSMQASPYGQLADQDLPAWLNNVLTRAETCKGPNAKARFLQYILLERFNNTVHLCKFYPTDDNLYTERIKTFMSSIPQEYIEKWHCKPLYTAEETRQLRLNYIKDGLKFHPEMPKARDAALEAKYRQKILSVRPEAKIKMMVFASDATAEWQVKKTYAGVPTRRMKRGWAVVECPGQDFYGLVWFSAEQEYLGGGKYGASSVSVSVPPINDKMIYTEEWQFCKM